MIVFDFGLVILKFFMFQILERMLLWPNLEYQLFKMNIVNEEKKVARHKLIQSFVLSLNVKPEFPVDKPTILAMPMLKTLNRLS